MDLSTALEKRENKEVNDPMPLVSIVTPVLNAQATIEQAIKSVVEQNYGNIEYVVVEGQSSDSTPQILAKYKEKISKLIIEPQRGLFRAMNTGIKACSGEIIGILNADDFYASKDAISTVVNAMVSSQAEACWSDLEYVRKDNPEKVIRYWKSSSFSPLKIRLGWMPPHPTLFVRKSAYDKCGLFDEGLKVSADYDMILKLLYKHKISTRYIPRVLLRMRSGGNSGRNALKKRIEDYKICRSYGLGLSTLILKNLTKAPQFIFRTLS